MEVGVQVSRGAARVSTARCSSPLAACLTINSKEAFVRSSFELALLVLVLSFTFLQCSSDDEDRPKPQAYHHADSLNAILMKELRAKTVVMLSDLYPGHIMYSQCVASFLNSWLNQLQWNSSDSTIPRKIILALEMGSTREKELNDFLNTGDRYPLLRSLIDEQIKFDSDVYRSRILSADYLHFCDELRNLKDRIASLNAQNHIQSIALSVVGAEGEPPYTYMDYRSQSRTEFNAKHARWMAAERDRKSSMRVLQVLRETPADKMLVFSGARHLVRYPTSGCYMARYLDSLIGRSNVSVFESSPNASRLKVAQHMAIEPEQAIEEYRHAGEHADFLVRMKPTPRYQFPFFLVKSQNTLRALVDLAERYEASEDTVGKDLSRTMLAKSLELLRRSHVDLEPGQSQQIALLQRIVSAATRRAIMTPNLFANIRRLISRFDAVQDVFAIDSVMITFAPSIEFYNAITTVLENLPQSPRPSSDTASTFLSPQERDTMITNWAPIWRQRKIERLTYMLMQVLWLGTPTEVSNALNALKSITKQEFKTPEEWDAWWRSTLEGIRIPADSSRSTF